ncbi:transcription factor Ouib-like [Teleopsis dalmanni]|uniref:transcription factor Ouib-like n=1 Tax=Teleopsis dalmanni TaxID=139649 RepID=UPI0018CC7C82|nr:transcription factor Ouib-like [Teleopsis dalmanni]XP_037955368.1 transcription factor Ouib-like [Teleopsis dalmanni]
MDLSWCRLCVNVVSSKVAENLFDNNKIMQEFKELVGIQLKNEADLPPYICEDCELKLEMIHEFRVRCLRAQSYFASNKFKERLDEAKKSIQENDMECNILVAIKNERELEFKQIHIFDSNCINEDVADNNVEHELPTDEDSMPLKTTTQLVEDEPSIYSKSKKKYSSDRPQICEICGRQLATRNLYYHHIRRHRGIKKHACNYCPKKFICSTEKIIHERTHTGERPFGCTYCDQRFSTEYRRKLHERSMHTNNRPHKCRFCCKGFVNNKSLQKHLLIHIGQQFCCEPCGKSFSYKCNYHTHLKSLTHKRKLVEAKQTICD